MIVRKIKGWGKNFWTGQLLDGTAKLHNLSWKVKNFENFAELLSLEAEIVCNPIMSLHALHSCESPADRKILKDRNKATVFNTQYSLSSFLLIAITYQQGKRQRTGVI